MMVNYSHQTDREVSPSPVDEAFDRAACAAICDAESVEWDSDAVVTEKNHAAHCAHRIRARPKF